MYAVNVGGSLVVDEELIPKNAPSSPLDYFLADALAGLPRCEQTCRAGHPPLDLKGKTIILVDLTFVLPQPCPPRSAAKKRSGEDRRRSSHCLGGWCSD